MVGQPRLLALEPGAPHRIGVVEVVCGGLARFREGDTVVSELHPHHADALGAAGVTVATGDAGAHHRLSSVKSPAAVMHHDDS